MDIRWLLFVPAMLLLFYPVDHAINDRVRLKTFIQIEGGTWWKFPWICIDPLRAAAGGWLLRLSWVVEPPLVGPFKYIELVGTFGIVLIAVFIQTHTRNKENAVLAPVGFVLGLTFVFLPPLVAGFVVVMALACLMISRHWAVFFVAGAGSTVFFGYLMRGNLKWVLAFSVIMLVPLAVCYTARKILLLPVRAQRQAVGSRKR